MQPAVCTLYEGHYHYGVAALINSLHSNNFKGDIYVGYRGQLPAWASTARPNPELNWENATTIPINDGIVIHFLPVNTTWHLTNYKPRFMINLFEGPAKNADSLSYFDPDIVVKANWNYFENWMKYGVALVHEIVTNDMPESHPLRRTWEGMISDYKLGEIRKVTSYINAGFCGVKRNYVDFLYTWERILQIGENHFGLEVEKLMSFKRPHPFRAPDQDALNITAMCSKSPISEMGPEGMGFIHGVAAMYHAVGSPKPWKNKFINNAFKGIRPSIADKAFWMNIDGFIKTHSKLTLKYKRSSLAIASTIGRFYRK